VILNILQIFNEKHNQDFSTEDKEIKAGEDEVDESELFISPKRKQ